LFEPFPIFCVLPSIQIWANQNGVGSWYPKHITIYSFSSPCYQIKVFATAFFFHTRCSAEMRSIENERISARPFIERISAGHPIYRQMYFVHPHLILQCKIPNGNSVDGLKKTGLSNFITLNFSVKLRIPSTFTRLTTVFSEFFEILGQLKAVPQTAPPHTTSISRAKIDFVCGVAVYRTVLGWPQLHNNKNDSFFMVKGYQRNLPYSKMTIHKEMF